MAERVRLTKKRKDGPGRKTKFRPEYVARAARYYRSGYTDVEVTAKFAVSVSTLYYWANKFPEFSESMQTPKQIADRRIVAAAYSCANKATDDPAYQQSMKMWLQNRMRDEWYRGPVDASTPINMQINFPFSLAELEKALPEDLERLQAQLARFNPSFVQAHQGMLIDATATRVETAQRGLDDHTISEEEAFGED